LSSPRSPYPVINLTIIRSISQLTIGVEVVVVVVVDIIRVEMDIPDYYLV
jgi:hypothetical protein